MCWGKCIISRSLHFQCKHRKSQWVCSAMISIPAYLSDQLPSHTRAQGLRVFLSKHSVFQLSTVVQNPAVLTSIKRTRTTADQTTYRKNTEESIKWESWCNCVYMREDSVKKAREQEVHWMMCNLILYRADRSTAKREMTPGTIDLLPGTYWFNDGLRR